MRLLKTKSNKAVTPQQQIFLFAIGFYNEFGLAN